KRRPGTRRFIMAGQDVLNRLRLLLDCRELLGKVLDCVTKQAGLGDGCVEKADF
ncbi:hypothetical protein M9458_039794, partial [Cirrhinus mrigala]